MDPQPLQRIVIVGGGSAGWLSAAYLERALGPKVHITLVESTDVDPVGVGESTLPTLGTTMAFLGFEEPDWMPACGATYKAAIRFRDWAQDPVAGRPTEFFHPFIGRPEPTASPFDRDYLPQVQQGLSIIHYALEARLTGQIESLAEALAPGPELVRQGLAPRRLGAGPPDIAYGYHVDAGRLGSFLRDWAKHRGVHHVVDHVDDIEVAQGEIRSLRLRSGGRLDADLFIDCSGFRGLLLNEALGAPFESFADQLLCDRAVAVGLPPTDDLAPCTTAHALTAGWSWEVPLLDRRGGGYVYSSRFLDEQGAEEEVRKHFSVGPDAPMRHLHMRVGRTPEAWRGNCVGIGLSAGFIEPLEATGIFLAEFGLAALVNLFSHRPLRQARRDAYNRQMAKMYENILDFVQFHYTGSHRTDPFWVAARAESTWTPRLAERVALLEEGFPVLDRWQGIQPFLANSWAFVADGLDRLPKHGHPLLALRGADSGAGALQTLMERRTAVLQGLPDHRTYLLAMQRQAAA